MTIVLEIPKIPKLECTADGKIGKKALDEYFKNIGRTIGRMSVATNGLDDTCSLAVAAAIAAIEELTKPINAITTDPFQTLKSKELEYKYRARELGKDIEEYFKKKKDELK